MGDLLENDDALCSESVIFILQTFIRNIDTRLKCNACVIKNQIRMIF
jgi:hypothetical protein